MNALPLVAALLVATAVAGAQDPSRSRDVGTRLHAARLREVLDLDVQGAIAEYQAIANDRSSRLERWIAVTRLAELQRAGVPGIELPPTTDAPPTIRAALATLTPLPIAALLRHAASPPANVLQANGGDAPRPPHLEAATMEAQRWVRSKSGPSLDDRQRQRVATMRNRMEAARNDNTASDRRYADDIVQSELAGRAEQATALRDLYFPTWRPAAATGEPAAQLPRVRTNLEAWLKEPSLSSQQQQLLGRLREEIEQRAATDAAAALALVRRLPVYAERLLAEPANR